MPVKVGLRYIELWHTDLEKRVRQYEEENAEKGQIVFYGPSYFTRWSADYGNVPLREALLGKSGKPCAVNRGFGSSCSEHQLYYYPRMVRALEPKVLVYGSHGNSASFGYTPEETWELAQRVVMYALTDFPDIQIYLCSAQNTEKQTEEAIEKKKLYNSWVKEFCEKTPNCHYVDLLNYEPLQRKDIFVADGVHFNAEGYRIYTEFFKEALKDELAKY